MELDAKVKMKQLVDTCMALRLIFKVLFPPPSVLSMCMERIAFTSS